MKLHSLGACMLALSFVACGALPVFKTENSPAEKDVYAASSDYRLESVTPVAYGSVFRYAKKDGSLEACVAKDFGGNVLSVTRNRTAEEAEEDRGGLPAVAVVTKQTDLNGDTVDAVADLTGGVYTLSDPLRNIYVYNAHRGTGQFLTDSLLYRNDTGVFDDPVAITSYLNLVKVYDFYASGGVGVPLRGVDGSHDKIAGNEKQNGESNIRLLVHYGINEQNAHGWFEKYDNAAVIGVGDGLENAYFYQLGRAVDIVAHEYQHTITHFRVDFTQMNESGAIDEAISDMLGALAEGHELTDERFWRMGEDAVAKNDRAVRSMKEPSDGYRSSFDDLFPACHELHDHNTAGCDFGGVHYNSTVLTHAQYLMWQEMPEYFTRARIGKLWYSVIPLLNKDSDFDDFKQALVQTAENLGFRKTALNVMRKTFGLPEEGTDTYTVAFVNADGEDLFVTEVRPGEDAVYVGEEPTLPATAQYEYTFDGWDKEAKNVQSDLTVTAKYKETLRTYSVLFLDENGVVLKRETVGYGMPATPPDVPDRPIDEESAYLFAGWDGDCTFITGETSFHALFKQGARRYRVRFYSGSELLDEEILPYGTEISLSAPLRDGYEFEGWYLDESCKEKAESATVRGDLTLYAGWTKKGGCKSTSPFLPLLLLPALPLFRKKRS